MSPRPTNATVGALYGATYAPYVHRRANAAILVGGAGDESPLKAKLSAAYLDGPIGRSVLDFGCGTSDFLDAAREAGWRTVGCDFSAHGVESTRAAGHETRVVTDSFWDWFGAERFDAIRLNHVIEHQHHPGAQLNKLMQSLEPGGLLHIVTPNPDGAACRFFRRSSLFFEAVHLTLLPPAALTRSAVSAGAKDVVIVDEHGSKDLWRSWQLSRRRASNYTHAEQEPQRAWQRRALRILARFTARPDRYHAFIRA